MLMMWIVLAVVAVAAIVWFVTRKSPELPASTDAKKPEEPASLPEPKVTPALGERADAPAPVSVKPATAAPETTSTAAPVSRDAEARTSTAATAPTTEPAAEPPSAEAPAPAPVAEAAPVAAPTAPVEAPKPPRREEKAKDLTALKKGLQQTRSGWMQKLFAVFTGRKEIDPALLEQIEETLLTGDVGTATTKRFIDGLKDRLSRKELDDDEKVWAALKDDAHTILDLEVKEFGPATTKPFVVLMVGVNGAGKTTTIAKLATRFKDEGRSVLLAAGDTFRAAAVAQLEMWGKRVGVPVHKGKDGAKPSAVVYEAVAKAVADGTDVVIADTAGRLQTKAPLMEELRKIREACGKASAGAPHEVLLVLDATTGQNAISQAREFRETLDLTGVVLTKLDGTARGGVILAIADEFKLPVRFIGVGEKSDDLREFDARDFVDTLFSRGDSTSN